jgi:hypothetical protein
MIEINSGDTMQEALFRQVYAIELKKKRKLDNFGYDALGDELKQVNQQELKTPGRRGETIKREEINKEILRRLGLDKLKIQ